MLLRKGRACLVEMVSWIRVRYYRFMGITIGKNCFIAIGAHIDVRRGRVVLGDNVEVAGGSYILGHTGWRPEKEGQETRLENGVRVFVNAVVLPGITIGENSIVGAGSVVARNVPPNVIVMGNPARVIEHLQEEGKTGLVPESAENTP